MNARGQQDAGLGVGDLHSDSRSIITNWLNDPWQLTLPKVSLGDPRDSFHLHFSSLLGFGTRQFSSQPLVPAH